MAMSRALRVGFYRNALLSCSYSLWLSFQPATSAFSRTCSLLPAFGITTTDGSWRSQFRATWLLVLPRVEASSSRTRKGPPLPFGNPPWAIGLAAITMIFSLLQYGIISSSTLLSTTLYSTIFHTLLAL